MTSKVITIDCQYISSEFAAAYLLIENDRAVFIENNTYHAVPILLKALEDHNIPRENVDHLIVTHIHLDHAGGSSELLKYLPNAKVLAHPKAANHLINPSRLIESSKKVYGEDLFEKLYGKIHPISEDKVRVMQDNEELEFGNRKLKFIYTKGHANHHFVIYDSSSNGVFTGDSFGISYPFLRTGKEPFLFPTTTPTDFNAEEARKSVHKIIETGADKIFLTHFGVWNDIQLGKEQMLAGINEMEKIFLFAKKSSIENEILIKECEFMIKVYMEKEMSERGLLPYMDNLKGDFYMNAQGLVYAAKRSKSAP